MRFILIIILFQGLTISAQEVNKNIFGFATSNTFTYCDILDSSFSNKVIGINPGILRFPGGAVGNFYHFGKAGYGFDFNEIDKYHSGKFPKRARGLEVYRKKNKQKHDYIDDFISLIKKTNAKAVLVANPFVESDSDIISMIQKLYANNIEVVGVELGSELSNRSYFLQGYTIDDYIVFSQRCSKKIKDIFPEIETAVVAAPLGKRRGHRHNIWNSKLASLNFYDAIIIHSYAKVIKGKTLDGQMVDEELESKNKTKNFEIYKDRILNYFNEEYFIEIEQYVDIFNKPIWVTEWNLQMSKTTGNTLLQSLFVAQYFLEILSNPDLSFIELTSYHNLGGRDFSGSIFRGNKDRIEIQSTYYPIKMIGKIFKNKVVNVKKERTQDIYLYKCYDKSNKEVLRYTLDWKTYEFKCQHTKPGFLSNVMVYKSINLFDTADNLGMLDFEIYEFSE